ncbi:MAG: hypothetical protein VKJ24_06915, partial [Synechococcales bacterium]|nr:hypothetical protein [Synechococcales bacterium]
MPSSIYWLGQISSQERELVGDRAWLLQVAMQMGHPVAPGFVLSPFFLQPFHRVLEMHAPEILRAGNSVPFTPSDPLLNPAQLERHVTVKLQQQCDRIVEELSAVRPSPEACQALSSALYKSALSQGLPTVLLSLSFPSMVPATTTAMFPSQLCIAEVSDVLQGILQLYQAQLHPKFLLHWQQCRIDWIRQPISVMIQPIAGAIASGQISLEPAGGWVEASWGLPWHGIRSIIIPEQYAVQIALPQGSQPATESPAHKPLEHRPLEHKPLEHRIGSLLTLRSPSPHHPNQTLAYALPSHPLPRTIVPQAAQLGADISPLQPYWIQPRESILQGDRATRVQSLLQSLYQNWQSALQAEWLLLSSQAGEDAGDRLVLLSLAMGASLRVPPAPMVPPMAAPALASPILTGFTVGESHYQGEAIVIPNPSDRLPLPHPLPPQALI